MSITSSGSNRVLKRLLFGQSLAALLFPEDLGSQGHPSSSTARGGHGCSRQTPYSGSGKEMWCGLTPSGFVNLDPENNLAEAPVSSLPNRVDDISII